VRRPIAGRRHVGHRCRRLWISSHDGPALSSTPAA
jgi:hypothetical protein